MTDTISVTITGVWDPAQGGTGADRSGSVAGRVHYNGAAGVTADDANLFWDGANLGVGNPSPTVPLDVYTQTTNQTNTAQFIGHYGGNIITQFVDTAYSTSNSCTYKMVLKSSTTTRTAFQVNCNFSDVTNATRTTTLTFQSADTGTFATYQTVVGKKVTWAGVQVYQAVPQLSAGNNTGGGSAALGGNCPATFLTAPYTWVDITAADGTLCTMPIWQK